MPSSTTPVLAEVDASNFTATVEALKSDGCLIIKNLTTPEIVERINNETRPYLLADKPWKGALFPPETRRCTRLVTRSETFREKIMCHTLVEQLTEHFLAKTTSCFYDETKLTYTTHPIVSTSVTLEVNPGSKAQRLHRDDKIHHVVHTDQTKTGYQVGSDISMAFLLPGVKTTFENGATLAVPKSHLWDSNRAPKREEAGFAYMEPGDCYVMLGGTYHGGGANITTDQKRPVHSMFWCQGILRAEENHYLANSKEEILSWSPEVQRKMGLCISSPNLGFVDFLPPIAFLSGDYDPENIPDLDPLPQEKA